MTAIVNVIFAVLALALVLESANALTCFSCSSRKSDPPCGDPMNITDYSKRFSTKVCDATASMNSYGYNQAFVCKKIVLNENGYVTIRRSCEIPNADEKDVKNGPCGPQAMQNHLSVISCDICNTDFCNSADSITGSRVFQFFAIALVLSGVSSFNF